MITISLCMIVKNEEKVIGRCLDCIKDIVDEIIIVDTGSTDATKEIAKNYTDKIYDFEWIDDFSAARNFSCSKATKNYIMWLDADDVIFEEDRTRLKALKKTLNPSVNMVMMKYNVGFDNKGNLTLSYYRERLFMRMMNYVWLDPIHEVITPSGNIIHSDIAVTHKKIHRNDPERNLRIFKKMISNGEILNTRQKFYYARELYYSEQYSEAIACFHDFLYSEDGWLEDRISACKDLAACYYSINKEKEALHTLLLSLEYDKPRAEICCDIGKHFFTRKQYDIAIFWYKLAKDYDPHERNGGFHLVDCYSYIPNIQLCVCYDRLGNKEKAIFYNEEASKSKPGDASVLYNRKYFSNIL